VSRKAKTNGSTILATLGTASPSLQITRTEANARIKARALELYHEARTLRDEHIRAFEAEYGLLTSRDCRKPRLNALEIRKNRMVDASARRVRTPLAASRRLQSSSTSLAR